MSFAPSDLDEFREVDPVEACPDCGDEMTRGAERCPRCERKHEEFEINAEPRRI